MRDHSFGDVARTPMEDFELATTSYVKPSWIGKSTHLWMCGASKNGNKKEWEVKESVPDNYIPKPFLEHKFEPLVQMDVLATVTVSTNDVNPTLFCDK